MTITADKAATQPAATGSTAQVDRAKTDAGPEKPARPALAQAKRALGRGLESLLPGPRPLGGGASTLPPASAGAPATTLPAGSNVSPQGTAAGAASAHIPNAPAPLGPNDGAPVPGNIPDLQAAAARRPLDGHEVLELAIDRIDRNPHQTRSFTTIEVEALDELADSIKVQGVLQPITVRPGKDGRYFLITGERRMRASEMAGKKTIPAIVRVVSEQQAAEMTVIENLQRRDLTCIDLARAYIMLSKNFGMTQEQIGERVGAARETVSNYMRLAKLPDLVHHYLQQRQLEFSHARVLLNLDPEVVARVAHKAATENMSVDDLERYVLFNPGMLGPQAKKEPKPGGARWVDPNVRAAQRDLERILGMRVRIRDRKGKGKITLEYATLEDFDRVVEMLKGKQ
jgi:ParB family transcriptional regulator, chromosome partitioning protein